METSSPRLTWFGDSFKAGDGRTVTFETYENGFLRDLDAAVANCDPIGVFRVVANYLAPLRPTYFGLEEPSAARRVVEAAIDQLRNDMIGMVTRGSIETSVDLVIRRVLTLHSKGVIEDQIWNQLLDAFPDNELPFPRLGSQKELMDWVDSTSYRRAIAAIEQGGYARLFRAFKIIDAGLSVMDFSEDVADRLRWQRNNPNYIKLRARFVLAAQKHAELAITKLGFARSSAWPKLVNDIDSMMRYLQAP